MAAAPARAALLAALFATALAPAPPSPPAPAEPLAPATTLRTAVAAAGDRGGGRGGWGGRGGGGGGGGDAVVLGGGRGGGGGGRAGLARAVAGVAGRAAAGAHHQQHGGGGARAARRRGLPALPSAQPRRARGVVGAAARLAHYQLRRLHVHQRRALPGAAQLGVGRLGAADQVRAETRQRHVRVPGVDGGRRAVAPRAPAPARARGLHPRRRRVPRRRRLHHQPRLHHREESGAAAVRVLVPQRAHDQLRRGARRERRDGAGRAHAVRAHRARRHARALRQLLLPRAQHRARAHTRLRLRGQRQDGGDVESQRGRRIAGDSRGDCGAAASGRCVPRMRRGNPADDEFHMDASLLY